MLRVVYGETVLKKYAVVEWHKWFKGQEDVKGDRRIRRSKMWKRDDN